MICDGFMDEIERQSIEVIFYPKLELLLEENNIKLHRNCYSIDEYSYFRWRDETNIVECRIYISAVAKKLVRLSIEMQTGLKLKSHQLDSVWKFINSFYDFTNRSNIRTQLEKEDQSKFFIGKVRVDDDVLYLEHNILVDTEYFNPRYDLDPYHIIDTIRDMMEYIIYKYDEIKIRVLNEG